MSLFHHLITCKVVFLSYLQNVFNNYKIMCGKVKQCNMRASFHYHSIAHVRVLKIFLNNSIINAITLIISIGVPFLFKADTVKCLLVSTYFSYKIRYISTQLYLELKILFARGSRTRVFARSATVVCHINLFIFDFWQVETKQRSKIKDFRSAKYYIYEGIPRYMRSE